MFYMGDELQLEKISLAQNVITYYNVYADNAYELVCGNYIVHRVSDAGASISDREYR